MVREVYTILDLLSDIGGLQGSLVTVIGFFLSVWNYKSVESYMVSRLFRGAQGGGVAATATQQRGQSQNNLAQSESVWTSATLFFFNNCCVPNRFLCCRRKQERFALLEKAHTMLESELDFVQMIRLQRSLYAALQHLLEPAVFNEIKRQSQYRTVGAVPGKSNQRQLQQYARTAT